MNRRGSIRKWPRVVIAGWIIYLASIAGLLYIAWLGSRREPDLVGIDLQTEATAQHVFQVEEYGNGVVYTVVCPLDPLGRRPTVEQVVAGECPKVEQ